MKTKLLYVLAGIAIGVFGYTIINHMILGSLGGHREATPNRLMQSNDIEQLKRQLERSQKRVTQLESLIGAASLANDRINRMSGNRDKNVEKIDNLKSLIDNAKPFFRELLLPELEEAMAEGEFGSVNSFMQSADELGLSALQRKAIKERFDELSRERAEKLIDQIKDDETSMFALFKELTNEEAELAPEVDAIYQAELDSEQFQLYQEKQLEKRIQRVSDQADSQLDRLNSQVTDLTKEQQDQIYVMMARKSPHYSTDMEIEIEGSAVNNLDPITSEDQLFGEIDQIILPHQRDDWKKYQRRQTLLSGLGIN